ncbi:hypothetical protein BgiBS90_024659 [Biomphalaria glabrata]|nr:hypothetical protein BgiBS90_024659 [Biomphalaria glabrata]
MTVNKRNAKSTFVPLFQTPLALVSHTRLVVSNLIEYQDQDVVSYTRGVLTLLRIEPYRTTSLNRTELNQAKRLQS